MICGIIPWTLCLCVLIWALAAIRDARNTAATHKVWARVFSDRADKIGAALVVAERDLLAETRASHDLIGALTRENVALAQRVAELEMQARPTVFDVQVEDV